tara:strand:+ start:245 stop:427 length:183 start_codon:yes stop_codon:yes gene_type:complete
MKKYELKIYYDPETQEILELKESFSDCDKCVMYVNDEEVEIPEDMQEEMRKIDVSEIGVC